MGVTPIESYKFRCRTHFYNTLKWTQHNHTCSLPLRSVLALFRYVVNVDECNISSRNKAGIAIYWNLGPAFCAASTSFLPVMGKIRPVKESSAVAPPRPPRSNVERQRDWDRNGQGEKKACLCKHVAAEFTLATLGLGGWRGDLQRFKCTTGFIFPVTGSCNMLFSHDCFRNGCHTPGI